jgi:hypothetical protein
MADLLGDFGGCVVLGAFFVVCPREFVHAGFNRARFGACWALAFGVLCVWPIRCRLLALVVLAVRFSSWSYGGLRRDAVGDG